MLSMHSEETLVRQALAAGARGYILKNALDLDLAAAVKRVAAGETVLDPSVSPAGGAEGRAEPRPDAARAGGAAAHLRRPVEPRDRGEARRSASNTVAVHRANIMNALGMHKTAELVVYAIQHGLVNAAVNRRDFLRTAGCGAALGAPGLTDAASPAGDRASPASPGFRLVDVTAAAGLQFRHNSGAYGGKLLPETLGSGCAFLDYDADGWQDILLVNGMDWPGHKRQRSTLRLYRNNRNGTFTDVTRSRRPRRRDVRHGRRRRRLQQRRLSRSPHHLRRPEPAVPQHRARARSST